MTASTVLVIDDHGGFRATARRLLERDGWTVVGEAADGRSGLAAAAELAPDVVLLDLGLPDIDGFTVAEHLAVRASTSSVVLISSRDPEAYGDRVRTSPVAGFIAKDRLDGAALRSLVAAALP
ncbi:MAG TPA: response regulator transcription factor [Candidatus Limnocylindrales bacterium]|nr:response regulator transcription factor [Candidatus Limnocylindrales bacterium]